MAARQYEEGGVEIFPILPRYVMSPSSNLAQAIVLNKHELDDFPQFNGLQNYRRANGKTVTPPCNGRGLSETFAHREAGTRCTASERPERQKTSS